MSFVASGSAGAKSVSSNRPATHEPSASQSGHASAGQGGDWRARGSNDSRSNRPPSASGNSNGYGEPAARGKLNWKGKSTWRGKPNGKSGPRADAEKTPDPILFQTYFKSVGPRTYAAQLKRAGNGNHFLVFTEGKRDKVTDEVRKTSLYVFSEDFVSFFKMLKETAEYVKSHPLPAEVAQKRMKFWEKQKSQPARG